LKAGYNIGELSEEVNEDWSSEAMTEQCGGECGVIAEMMAEVGTG
jgi:hypothetical protein